MKLLIAGSRGITEYDLAPHIPADTDLIISGGAKGVDTIAEQYADSKRISKLILRPRYDLYRRAYQTERAYGRAVRQCSYHMGREIKRHKAYH